MCDEIKNLLEKANQSKDDINPYNVYCMLWKCRDFELSTLWQRSVFLGAFLIASYTGYGAIILKLMDATEANRLYIHFSAIGVSCFGILFAALWILMMKGSKAWYEHYEAAINTFVECYSDSFKGLRDKKHAAFGIAEEADFLRNLEKRDFAYFSVRAGKFSVSKIAIGVGQISLIGWILIAIAHLALLILPPRFLALILGYHLPEIALTLFLFTITLVVFCFRNHFKSSHL